MNSKQKRYLLRNYPDKTVQELSGLINIPEDDILTFLESAQVKPVTQPSSKLPSSRPSGTGQTSPSKTTSTILPEYALYLPVVVFGLLIYSNTFLSSFHFDDKRAIIRNPFIRDFWDWSSIWNAFNTRFIVGLTLALNYALGGLNVVGYHVFNIGAHIAASCLVYQLAFLTLRTHAMRHDRSEAQARLMAIFASLIFLAHPIQTQAVTYIWQRAASLAAIFYIAALVFYVRSRMSSSFGLYVTSLVCTVLGMFCKENTLTLPLSIAFYEFCFLGKPGESVEKRIGILLPFFLTMFIIPATLMRASAITLDLMRPQFAENTEPLRMADLTSFVDRSVMERSAYIFTQLSVLRTYLRLLFLPVRQNLDYDYPLSKSFFEPSTLFSFGILSVVIITAVILLKKHRLAGFGLLWIFLTLSIESAVPQNDVIFEHRLYLPMVGFALFLIASVDWFVRMINRQSLAAAVLLPLVFVYGTLAYQRNHVWKDEMTLWEDVIRKSPNKARPYQNRGVAYQDQGRIEEALRDFNKALEIKPAYDRALYNRGTIYLNRNEYDRALQDFNKALEISPDYDKALNNRALIYLRRNQYEQALPDLNKAISIDPTYVDPYLNAALCYYSLGKYDKSWEIVHQLQKLGGTAGTDFIERLKRASGKDA